MIDLSEEDDPKKKPNKTVQKKNELAEGRTIFIR